MGEIIAVLHALIDAAFSSGGITDRVQQDLHARLDAAVQPEPAPEPVPVSPAPAEVPAPAFGTETYPYA